jgi:hypothetical protein
VLVVIATCGWQCVVFFFFFFFVFQELKKKKPLKIKNSQPVIK